MVWFLAFRRSRLVCVNVEISARHDQLVMDLYNLREKFSETISADERLILEAAIHLLEYLVRRKDSQDHEEPEPWTQEAIERLSKRVRPPRTSRFTWTFEEFERFIGSGGFELADGHLEPRF